MNKKYQKSKKLSGIDIYICISNEKYEEELTVSKPYRVIKLCRRDDNSIVVLVKNEQRERDWYPLQLFRRKNEK